RILYISDADIFQHTKKKGRRSSRRGSEIKVFTDINKGDYVVHETHGIGRFMGVEKLTVDGSTRDYLKIRYAQEDVLYVPVDQMESIQKYVGSEGVEPKINRLSGNDWQKTKARAKAAIKDMAADFLKLSAERSVNPGYHFGPDSTWQKEFEDAFPYQETDDQLRCVEEIKKDMESDKAMDRLLCGDVGFGKTEVAARAIFKCLEEGKQAAVLVPTTILANQHYMTLTDRFSGYPFRIDMLSRFRTEKQQSQTITDLASGNTDLVIGTHRLLSKDVHFKDLGLLVIDEEQRFGVEHKEAIKQLKTNVDVLTLSATPIPRTLHMSLIGVRDMSVIEQPPEDRYPVQTYVMEQDDNTLADAIRRELGRDGQVYVVYNRVKGIQNAARHIQELVPEAKISVGHGQMSERQLEDVMMEFVSGETQILIATTIIESGLDIPNVNTMIILDADRFGLSQLYQLRGRVGRSNRMAYAYLMYKKDKVLSEIAEKRLRAIREFTEFGAGFRV
ncbi:MAG: DEAD/DEAH box helicase, partial [Firmicutes bacterium]|nr:DEAD/DEAH box helicase [Bacillota bacterium]